MEPSLNQDGQQAPDSATCIISVEVQDQILQEVRALREQFTSDLRAELRLWISDLDCNGLRHPRTATSAPVAGMAEMISDDSLRRLPAGMAHAWVERNVRSYRVASELAMQDVLSDAGMTDNGSGAVALLPTHIEKGSGPLAQARRRKRRPSNLSHDVQRHKHDEQGLASEGDIASDIALQGARRKFLRNLTTSSASAESSSRVSPNKDSICDGGVLPNSIPELPAKGLPTPPPPSVLQPLDPEVATSLAAVLPMDGSAAQLHTILSDASLPGQQEHLPMSSSRSHVSSRIPPLRRVANKLVRSQWFDAVTVVFIAGNALIIGLQTDYCARNLTEEAPSSYQTAESVFSIFFVVELALRLGAFGRHFFTMPGRGWNLLDFSVVSLQVLEELLNWFNLSSDSSSFPVPLTLMRIARVLRLVRIIRVVRLLRYMTELRTIVVSTMASMKPLISTITLLLLVVYIIGCYFTQLALNYQLDCDRAGGCKENGPEDMKFIFGSLGSTSLHLFQTVTNGLEWRHMSRPLIEHVSPWMGVIFALYIVFTALALMNVVTGVFVETALLRGKEDKDVYMINHLRDLFGLLDEDNSGTISWDELEANLTEPRLLAFLKEIDIDVSEAKGLFHLLDRDGSGVLDADEFLSGCLRLRGPAKALDMQLVMCELAEHRRFLLRLLGDGAHGEVDRNLLEDGA